MYFKILKNYEMFINWIFYCKGPECEDTMMWMRRVVWRWFLRAQRQIDERILQENLRILLPSWR
jgi:hypothetical protein